MDKAIIWQNVVGYEGLYQVSNKGQVQSLPRATTSGRLLKQHFDGHYFSVTLSKKGRTKTIRVHQLIARAFLGEPLSGQVVCHNNGNSYDNRLDNLRYDSASANSLDKQKHGTDHYSSRTKCKHGHEYTEENTRWYKGSRWCKKCTDRNNKKYREKTRRRWTN